MKSLGHSERGINCTLIVTAYSIAYVRMNWKGTQINGTLSELR